MRAFGRIRAADRFRRIASYAASLRSDLLALAGIPRGSDPDLASVSRSYLADVDIKIRIDDPDNGSWMPKTKADARPTIYPDAIGHNRIHRQRYYDWIQNSLSIMDDPLQVRAFLNTVRTQLLHGNIKPEMKLQQEIDEAEYYDWLKKNQTL